MSVVARPLFAFEDSYVRELGIPTPNDITLTQPQVAEDGARPYTRRFEVPSPRP